MAIDLSFVPPGTIPFDIYMWRAFSAVSPSIQPTERGPHARAKVVYHEDATDSAPNFVMDDMKLVCLCS